MLQSFLENRVHSSFGYWNTNCPGNALTYSVLTAWTSNKINHYITKVSKDEKKVYQLKLPFKTYRKKLWEQKLISFFISTCRPIFARSGKPGWNNKTKINVWNNKRKTKEFIGSFFLHPRPL